MAKIKIVPKLEYEVAFQIQKELPYGKAVFVCGNIKQLGLWKPALSLRMTWHEGHVWKAILLFAKDNLHLMNEIQFKFIISSWNVNLLELEWQSGKNRIIRLSHHQKHHIYNAIWNAHKYIIFLRVNDAKQTDCFYILGSIPELGTWQHRQPMKKIYVSQTDSLWQYMKFNPQFIPEPSDYEIFMLEFTTDRSVQQFQYYYMSFGKAVKSQVYPGRTIKNNEDYYVEKDRLLQFDYKGFKVVLDESSFDQLNIQRITAQFYMANQLNLIHDFQRLINLKITSIYLIRHQLQPQDTFTLFQNTCKLYKISLTTKKVKDILNEIDLWQIKQAADQIDNMIIKKHRVCLIVSNKVVEMYPINFVELTLVLGYSFQHSLEIISREYGCGRDEDCLQLFGFIREKLYRGTAMAKKV